MHQTLSLAVAALLLTAYPIAAGEKTITLAVENMSCASCPYIVKQSLAGVQGVIHAEVSFENKTAAVTFDDTQTDLAVITAATAEAGFPSHPTYE
ncbi:cation transporter [Allomesorhizobium camelthorni]|uniref:Mercuric transport protein periplasmic component n=1 Tax=Allomesorhizobium camelthorni TaxID=475069 RepID=A0A6G4WHJ9_9HYPH|nr:cation transporter [Mesorhizobium camelthorni]NGO53600.1 mercuric transport protein periplasmic component [Mesorhizobium camelthorni]